MISQAGRVGSTIDQSVPVDQQKAVSLAAPLRRPVHITEDQVKDPSTLAHQLTALQQELAETTLATRSHPIQAPVIFSNVACGTAGAKTVVAHNFDRFAYFTVIGWRGNGVSAAPVLVSDQSDASNVVTDKNKIALRSYVAGTCDLMVF